MPLPTDPVFDRDKFLLRQKILTISEKYDVSDDQGNPIFFIERPSHFLRNLGAALAGILTGIVVAVFLGAIASLTSGGIQAFLVLVTILGSLAAMLVVSIALSAKRHVTFYRDQSKQEPLLKVFQDKKIEILTATFTVRDANDGDLAWLKKNYLYDIFRKQWNCYGPDGALICMAKEDSLALALLRRFLGTFFGILRTNFIIVQGSSERVIGEFNRKFTLFDRYVLDMSYDQEKILDRRIAIALGVMLDTGERR